MADNKGKLFLIPNVIAENTQAAVIPQQVREILADLEFFMAEDIRTARRYLSALKIFDSIERLTFFTLNKDTTREETLEAMAPLREGKSMGVISESGCPGVADPGALAVALAHEHSIQVVPLVGPSSILLALMGSGMNGQRFAFHGYLPVDPKEFERTIRSLEIESRSKNQTQILIETPYRNNNFFRHAVTSLHPETLLCVALDATGVNESISTRTVREWRMQSIEWPKKPAIFLFLAR